MKADKEDGVGPPDRCGWQDLFQLFCRHATMMVVVVVVLVVHGQTVREMVSPSVLHSEPVASIQQKGQDECDNTTTHH